MKYKNFPLAVCAAALEKIMRNLPTGSAFFQKWTCGGCGARVTGNTPNKLFTQGHHEECGHVTDITKTGCNYSLYTVHGGLASAKARGSS